MPLETKLHAPAPRREWLDRPGLIRRLSDTATRLVLVSAPAGFGKTTLIAQWRAGVVKDTPFAWISLDRADNAPLRLWRHVAAALQRACPELAEDEVLLSFPASAADITGAFLPGLVNRLAMMRISVVLVLDDYHVIKERACHKQMEFLLRHMPPSCRVVLITRANPPLPLARLRAAGDVTEIRMRELRFTAAEVAALVAACGARLEQRDVDDLIERTEGWPAGVYLAALSVRDASAPASFIRQFTGSNRFIVDFLTEEVLNHQPPEVRSFLMRTSILDRFTAPLCDSVAGSSNAAHILERIEQENLFLVPMDDKRVWFRYHHLFAQMLRSQLERTEPGITPRLQQRASAWHRTSGSAQEAIGYALAGGSTQEALDLIERHWPGFVSEGRAAMVYSWLTSLGDDRIGGDPVAAHCAAWVAAICGDQEAAHRWLAAAGTGRNDSPLPDGMRSLEFSAVLFRGTFGFDGLDVMRTSAARAAELEQNPASAWYSMSRAAHGFSLYLCGETAAASATLRRAVAGNTTIPLVRIVTLTLAALVAAEQGRPSQAEAFVAAARRIPGINDLEGTPQSSFLHTAIGALYAVHGSLKEARTEFEIALTSRRQALGVSPWPTIDILLRFAAVLIDSGDCTGANELVAEAADMLSWAAQGTGALRARLARLARRLASRSGGTPLAKPLTEREKAVLRMLRGSLSLREISRELLLSANTVKTHTRSIYRKLGVSTRAEAVQRARESGIML